MEWSDDLSELTQTISKIITAGVQKTKSMSSCCIFRVPKALREVKESAYTPQLVSIGPLHSNKEHLKSPMEDVKSSYVEALFKRVVHASGAEDVGSALLKCVAKMKESLDRARDCYAEKVEVNALVDVVKMKDLLDKVKECCPEKVDAKDVEKMKESLDRAKECYAEKVNAQGVVEKMKQLLDKAKECCAESVDAKDVQKMKESLDIAKECFAEKVDALDVTMLIIDGCFILELLYRYHHTYKRPKPDDEPQNHCYDGCIPFFHHKNPHHTETSNNINQHKNPHHTETSNNINQLLQDFCFDSALARGAIRDDLLLLENQLPFFVLEELFGLTVAKTSNSTVATIPKPLPSLGNYLLSYFGDMMNPSEQGGKNDLEPKIREGVSHILHFLHSQCCLERQEDQPKCWSLFEPCSKLLQDSPKTDVNDYDSMPPASELEYAGVRFKVSTQTGALDTLFKVKFQGPQGLFWCCRRACFEVPAVRLSDATEILLRNLIAFEQCYPGHHDFYFTSYAVLMDRLVNTNNDVKVLEEARVICSHLSDRAEASDLFNSLCKKIVVRNFYFAQTCNQAASYSKRCCWPKSLAYLRRKYFTYPWTFIAFLVAFIAFGMSVTQFIRSFLR